MCLSWAWPSVPEKKTGTLPTLITLKPLWVGVGKEWNLCTVFFQLNPDGGGSVGNITSFSTLKRCFQKREEGYCSSHHPGVGGSTSGSNGLPRLMEVGSCPSPKCQQKGSHGSVIRLHAWRAEGSWFSLWYHPLGLRWKWMWLSIVWWDPSLLPVLSSECWIDSVPVFQILAPYFVPQRNK